MTGAGPFAVIPALPLRLRKSAMAPNKPFPQLLVPAGWVRLGDARSALRSPLWFGSVSDQREKVAGNHLPA